MFISKVFAAFKPMKPKAAKVFFPSVCSGPGIKWRPLTKWLDKEPVSLATLFLLSLDVKETRIQIPTLPVSACDSGLIQASVPSPVKWAWNCCRKGEPLPGPQTWLLSNTWKWTVQGDSPADKRRDFIGKGHPGGEQEGIGNQENFSATWLTVSGFMVMGLVSGLSSANHSDSGSLLAMHALLSQDGCQQEGFWKVVGHLASSFGLSWTLPVGGGLLVPSSLPGPPTVRWLLQVVTVGSGQSRWFQSAVPLKKLVSLGWIQGVRKSGPFWGGRVYACLFQLLVVAGIPWIVAPLLQSLTLWSHCLLLSFLWSHFPLSLSTEKKKKFTT